MNRSGRNGILGLIAGFALLLQGCGGAGGSTHSGGGGANGPTTQTLTNVAQHLGSSGAGLVTDSFTAFQANAPISNGPQYDARLGLWVVTTITLSTYTRTFYQDQAETKPAGSAVYSLDISTETLSGTISITAGRYSGLSGTYSATKSGNAISGSEAFTLPSGTTVNSQFSVTLVSGGVTGTATETVTQPGGYSESSNVVRNADGTMKITASDSNGYQSTLNFAADFSGAGTINGPDPGLPATIKWNSAGTGTVTFANGTVLNFTDWQFPKP